MSKDKNLFQRIVMPSLKLLIAGGLIFYLFSSGRFSLENLKIISSPKVFVGGICIIGIVLYLASERWKILLTQQNVVTSSRKAFTFTLIGTFFSFFVPGGVGGDVIKAILLARDHAEYRGRAMLTVLADRILGLFSMTAMALFAFIFETELLAKEKSFQFIFLMLMALFVAFILIFWILLSKNTQSLRLKIEKLLQPVNKLQKLWILAQSYRLNLKQFTSILLLSLITQFLQVLLFVLVANELQSQTPDLSIFLFTVPVGFMVTAIPIAPAGIGIGQAAFAYLFSKALGHTSDIGIIGITAIQVFMLIYGLIGAILFVILKKESPSIEKAIAEESESSD